MTTYYEARITFIPTTQSREFAKLCVETFGWKFSNITGDITLGDDPKYYATHHYNSRKPKSDILADLKITGEALSDLGFTVQRLKLEHVIFDTRSSKVCLDNCTPCQEASS